MTLSALLIFALALLVAAGSPGPTVAALVSQVISRGLRDVLPFMAAIWLGEILWMTAAVVGLSALAKTLGSVFVVLKFAGAAYLLYLARQMWIGSAETAGNAVATEHQPWRLFGAGLIVALGNPKNMVFYIALLPTLVDLDHIGFSSWMELSLTMIFVLAGVDIAWAVAASRARVLLKSRRAVRIANSTGAAAMAGAALVIAAR